MAVVVAAAAGWLDRLLAGRNGALTVFINAYTLTSAVGVGLAALRRSLRVGRFCLDNAGWPHCDVPCFLGRVDLPEAARVPMDRYCRNNLLVDLALRQDGFEQAVRDARETFGAERCGVVVGTSTSGIDRTELAYRALDAEGRFTPDYRQPAVHNPHAPTSFTAERLATTGPCITVSAACASSAKVFATAKRWLEQGIVDAVVAGGADSLCLSVIQGFHSLQLVSPEPCRPFAPSRTGISLGEAAGFVLMSREQSQGAPRLLGVGESCDAYHMSSAPADGAGARLAMERALEDARLGMAEIDYVNLHGTGTRANDDIEGRVCGALMTEGTLASATKGWTGHALGAAGVVEVVLCLEALTSGLVPGTRNTTESEAPFDLVLENVEQSIGTALSNSFGFGGNNCSVVLGR